MSVNQTLLIGPDKYNQFKMVVVKNIHIFRQSENSASRPYNCVLNIKSVNSNHPITKKDIRKGMVMVDPKLNPKPVMEFDALVKVLHHSTHIQPGYQAVMHCGNISQCINFESMDTESLDNEQTGIVRCKFMYHAEYLKPDAVFMLREGHTKVYGKILTVYPKK